MSAPAENRTTPDAGPPRFRRHRFTTTNRWLAATLSALGHRLRRYRPSADGSTRWTFDLQRAEGVALAQQFQARTLLVEPYAILRANASLPLLGRTQSLPINPSVPTCARESA